MPKLIIVDDSRTIRKLLKKIIEGSDFEVVGEGSDGNEAIALFKELGPDLVLSDLTMPNKSGQDAMKEILDYDPNARVIIISSLSDKNIIDNCLKLGAKGYIEKPPVVETDEEREAFFTQLRSAIS
ncbi:MAG: response regulator [Bdellovibrionaceae bacterium]|nr:response regulator [Pseudobdellovibrionaceae bacterium]